MKGSWIKVDSGYARQIIQFFVNCKKYKSYILVQSQMSRRKQEKRTSNDGNTDKNLSCAEAQKRESAAIITYSK